MLIGPALIYDHPAALNAMTFLKNLSTGSPKTALDWQRTRNVFGAQVFMVLRISSAVSNS